MDLYRNAAAAVAVGITSGRLRPGNLTDILVVMKPAILRSGLVGVLIMFLFLLVLLLFNLVLLPHALAAVSAQLEDRTGLSVTIGESGYLPVRGLVLRDVDIRPADPTGSVDGSPAPVRFAARSTPILVRIPEIRVRIRFLPFLLPGSSAPVVRSLRIERPEVTFFTGAPGSSGSIPTAAPAAFAASAAAPVPDAAPAKADGLQDPAEVIGAAPSRYLGGRMPAIRTRVDRLVRNRYFPERVRVVGASLRVVPEPPHGDAPAGRAGEVSMFDADLLHRHSDRSIRITAGGRLGDSPRAGSWEGRLAFRYPDLQADGFFRITDLAAGSFTDPDGAPRTGFLRNGLLNVRMEFSLPGPGPGRSEAAGRQTGMVRGEIELTDGVLRIPRAAAEPIGGLDMSYAFSARIDPYRPIPEPRLILTSDPFAAGYDDADLSRPYGEIVFDRGDLKLGALELQVLPSLRGLSGFGAWSSRGVGGEAGSNDRRSASGAGSPNRESAAGAIPLPARIGLKVKLPETAVQRIVDAVPDALLGELEGLELDGSLAWDLDLEVPMDRVSHMNWISSPVLRDFRVRTLPEDQNVYRLNEAFSYRIVDESVPFERLVAIPAPREVPAEWFAALAERLPLDLLPADRRIGTDRPAGRREIPGRAALPAGRSAAAISTASPGAAAAELEAGTVSVGSRADGTDPDYRYVRLPDISLWIPRAVLTAEDGDFFFHDGINWNDFKAAVQRNLEAREILFGASTLTMQLGKNLFLDQQQLFSRKLQEAFLVFLVEHAAMVPKERILEIYLNIAEFGPGIFGIFDASRHYFGKDPASITASEAVWLASILPAPKRFHRYFEAGEISDAWFAHMKQYMDVMLERERMTEPEHREACAQKPLFVRADPEAGR